MSNRYDERDYSSRRSAGQGASGQNRARNSYSRTSAGSSDNSYSRRSARSDAGAGRSSAGRVTVNARDDADATRGYAQNAGRGLGSASSASASAGNRATGTRSSAGRERRSSQTAGYERRTASTRSTGAADRFSRSSDSYTQRRATGTRRAADSEDAAPLDSSAQQRQPQQRQLQQRQPQRRTAADVRAGRERPSAAQQRPSARQRTSARPRTRDNGIRLGTPETVSRPVEGLNAKRRGGISKLKIAIVAAVVVVLIGVGSAFAYINGINSNLHAGIDDDLRNSLVKTNLTSEPFYMVLLGTDGSAQRDAEEDFGGSYRSDSNMLVRIDPVNKKVTMVSIHRDTEVDLGEYGTQKINTAIAFGGPALAVQAISNMAGVPISHYASINFDGFKDLVDALGGVEVDVPVTIDDEDAGGHLDAGLQTLNGDQALILCRSRNTYSDAADPDSMRAANQRLVLSAIAKKVLQSDVATIANSVSAMSQFVTTDLEVNDIIGLAQAMQGLDPESDIYTAMDPVTNSYSTEDLGWHTYLNQDEWKAMMERIDQGLPPTEGNLVDESTGTVIATAGADAVDATVKTNWIAVQNGTTTAGLAFTAAEQLQASNFINAVADATDPGGFEQTLIIPYSSSLNYEAQQIQQVLGCGKIIEDDGTYSFSGSFLVIIGADYTPPATTSDSSSSSSSSGSSSS